VHLREGELARMAGYLNLTEQEFFQRYMRLLPNRQGLAIADKPNGECVFLQGKDCIVQPVKPQQCRDFSESLEFPRVRKDLSRHPQNGERGGA
jgi:Fe-S-cluster containining protein